MTCTQQSVHDPSSALTRIESATMELVVAATLLVASASIIAASTGDPELMAVVACVGIAITLLGLATLSANNRVGTDGNDSTDRSPR